MTITHDDDGNAYFHGVPLRVVDAMHNANDPIPFNSHTADTADALGGSTPAGQGVNTHPPLQPAFRSNLEVYIPIADNVADISHPVFGFGSEADLENSDNILRQILVENPDFEGSGGVSDYLYDWMEHQARERTEKSAEPKLTYPGVWPPPFTNKMPRV